jgi:pimeloyl-ACP methyl ester carboxylesterase
MNVSSHLRRLWPGLSLVSLALILTACANQPDSPSIPTIPLTDCQLTYPGVSIPIQAQCGKLTVLEDRQAGTGRTIDLNLAVLPAISRSPEPDPLFFLTGGPGQAATESFVALAGSFERIRQKRAIVLVDQRGTGQSNPLDCPDSPEASGEEAADRAAMEEWLRACLTNLDADPALYTTPLAMQDLDNVRQALGYEKINLYGLSYGSRAALTYLKMYPERVRTVILDGVVPQDEALGLEVAPDAQRAMDLLFARCEADEACRQAFPDLPGKFQQLMTGLEEGPLTVNFIHPVSGAQEAEPFTAPELAATVRLLSYTPETAALLPLLIHTSASEGRYDLLAAQSRLVSEDLSESISFGMNLSVLCAEDFPFMDLSSAERAARGTYLGNIQYEELEAMCAIWPRGQVPADFKEPVEGNTPVLLLSGEADPVTPPQNALQVAETLPNSLALTAAGQGHNVILRGCMPQIAYEFIQSGSTQNLDTTCVEQIQPSPFFLTFSGPQP